jgi:hypothetical protein
VAGNPRKGKYLRDTGATLCFISRTALPQGYEPHFTGENVSVAGINHVCGNYRVCRVPVVCAAYTGDLTAALTDSPPLPGVDVLLGNDYNSALGENELPGVVVTRSPLKENPALLEEEAGELDTLFSSIPSTGSTDKDYILDAPVPPYMDDVPSLPVTHQTTEEVTNPPNPFDAWARIDSMENLFATNTSDLRKEKEEDSSLAHMPVAGRVYYIDDRAFGHKDRARPLPCLRQSRSRYCAPRPPSSCLTSLLHYGQGKGPPMGSHPIAKGDLEET